MWDCLRGELTKRINDNNSTLKLELIYSTGFSLAQLLFNNKNNTISTRICPIDSKCPICNWKLRPEDASVISSAIKSEYPIDVHVCCHHAGIYCIQCKCLAQYTGKTICFSTRTAQHFKPGSKSSIAAHFQTCPTATKPEDFTIKLLENAWNRGKWTLSEREFLWNYRIKGSINIQKTLQNWPLDREFLKKINIKLYDKTHFYQKSWTIF